MVHTKYNFKWFEKEDNRRALRASISTDGKLRLGKPLCNVLPPYIRVGFDSKFKILAIADGHGTGIGRPHCGIMSAQALSAQIASTGLRFPLSFRLSRDERTGYFLGRIIPRRRLDKNSAQPQYDPEQLLILYQHLVDQMVSQLAKKYTAFGTPGLCRGGVLYRRAEILSGLWRFRNISARADPARAPAGKQATCRCLFPPVAGSAAYQRRRG